MLDVFTPSAFKLLTLTGAINKVPYTPTRIGQLGLFQSAGINTLDAVVEENGGSLSLLSAIPRGAPSSPEVGTNRTVRTFRVPHIAQEANIMADEVQGVRAFGANSQAEVLQTRINERLATMRRNIDYTIEAHRLNAIMGTMYNANGGTTSLFTEFGVSQQTVDMVLDSDTTEVRGKVLDAKIAMEDALGGIPYTGVHVLCGITFWKSLIEHPLVKESWISTEAASALRQDPNTPLVYAGATWEYYRGTSAVKIGDNDAYLIPMGVPQLFITRYGPADYNETVNSIGLPYYSKGEPLPFNKGWKLEAQSNPISLCTRPNAVIKLTV